MQHRPSARGHHAHPQIWQVAPSSGLRMWRCKLSAAGRDCSFSPLQKRLGAGWRARSSMSKRASRPPGASARRIVHSLIGDDSVPIEIEAATDWDSCCRRLPWSGAPRRPARELFGDARARAVGTDEVAGFDQPPAHVSSVADWTKPRSPRLFVARAQRCDKHGEWPGS
jgi:hypothetical protein